MTAASRIACALSSLVLLACSEPAPKPAGDTKAKADAKDPKADAKKSDAKTDTKTDTKSDTKAPPDVAPTTALPPPTAANERTWSFDDQSVGAVAAGFSPKLAGEVVDPPATWAVVDEPSAPSGGKAFGVTKTIGQNKTYNVALVDGTSYGDMEISVALKPTSGENNRGGGVVFRAKGENDHYVARWNPVENNFRIYAMLGGARVDIAAAPIELDEGAWHTLRVVVAGDAIECFMDDQSIVRGTDKSLPDAGMIGLWTKGDAATLFDDLVVEAAAK